MNNLSGDIKGTIVSERKLIDEIPKLIELFDSDLNRLYYEWIQGSRFSMENLKVGIYVIRVQIASDTPLEKVIHISEGSNEISIQDENAPEGKGISYQGLIRHRIRQKRHNEIKKDALDSSWPIKIDAPFVARWWVSDYLERWEYRGIEISRTETEDKISAFILQTERSANVLEVFDGFNRKLISMPPDNQVEVRIKPFTKSDRSPDLSISISTDNWKSETLLTLLSKGNIKEAKKLTTLQDAENLLLEKRKNAAAAAIGGYFLLKTGELDRLHDWANNLANWFPWMSDGCIIHAWQMIQSEDRERYLPQIKNRLIAAAFGAFPVYTEGFRLLNEGLSQLSYIAKEDDIRLERAYSKVKAYLTLIDWSQQNTTFNMRPSHSFRETDLPTYFNY